MHGKEPLYMEKLKGKKILITGAALGIGRCMAKLFARDGCELILTDLNETSLKQAVEELSGDGVKVHSYVVDVSNREEVEKMAADVIENIGNIDILINNAGIGHSGEIIETSLEKWKKLMDVNFWGPLYHIYAFLPSMVKAGKGHIVNMSSGQAFYRLPTWGPYAIIKLALGGFSELLRFELKKFKLKVTTVYPFMVNTGFYDDVEGETLGTKLSMKLLPYYSMTPEKVARIVYRAVKKQKPVEMVSVMNDIGAFSRSFGPLSNLITAVSLGFLGKNPEQLKENLLG
jgi:short-subunit dehydrogenase